MVGHFRTWPGAAIAVSAMGLNAAAQGPMPSLQTPTVATSGGGASSGPYGAKLSAGPGSLPSLGDSSGLPSLPAGAMMNQLGPSSQYGKGTQTQPGLPYGQGTQSAPATQYGPAFGPGSGSPSTFFDPGAQGGSGVFDPGGAGAGAAPGFFGGGGGGGTAAGLGGFAASAGGPPNMIGDMAPLVGITAKPAATGVPQPPSLPPPGQPGSPTLPNTKTRSQLAPSLRGFKIAENQSPFPQDRVFYSFNYFDDVNGKLNKYFESPINNLGVYRQLFGFEKTFNDGKGSFGIRLPINTIHAGNSSALVTSGGQSTSVGNATFFAKYILEYNPKTGNLLSVGLAITPPTGPGRFAGASFLGGKNTTTIQPFAGYYINVTERMFLQGFLALDVPVNFGDVTLVYNDLALGYYAYRDADTFVTAVVPTVEVHVNSPLNHRAPYSFSDPNGTADSVNITSGISTEFRRNSLFTLGVVVPVTGPRPFNVEAVALFNYRFGAPRRPRSGFPTPVIGG